MKFGISCFPLLDATIGVGNGGGGGGGGVVDGTMRRSVGGSLLLFMMELHNLLGMRGIVTTSVGSFFGGGFITITDCSAITTMILARDATQTQAG